MDAGNPTSGDFGLFQALANQVVRKGVCSVPRFCSLFSPFRPLSSDRRNWSTSQSLRQPHLPHQFSKPWVGTYGVE